MNDISTLVRKINMREALSENIPLYFEKIKDTVFEFHYLNTVFKYLSLAEGLSDKVKNSGILPLDGYPEEIKELFFDVKSVLERFYSEKTVPSYTEITALRNRNIKYMTFLSNHADLGEITEYIFNRTEDTENAAFFENYSDAAFTDEIINSVFSLPKDLRNPILSDIIKELPVRMTKSRFFDYTRDRLSVYLESDEDTFTDIISRLSSEAGLNPDFSMIKSYSVYRPLFEKSMTEDLFLLSKEEYISLRKLLDDYIYKITRDIELLTELEDIINGLLSLSVAGKTPEAENTKYKKLCEYADCALTDPDGYDPNETYRLLEGSEYELYSSNEALLLLPGTFEEIQNRFKKEIEDLGLTESVSRLLNVFDFTSGSRFSVKTNEFYEKKHIVLTKENFTGIIGEFFDALNTVFNNTTKMARRAVMSRVISGVLPVFGDINSFRTFIFDSLSSCGNAKEKQAVIGIIRILLEKNSALYKE